MADMTRLPDQVTTLRSTYVLKGMLHRGFTTVRDTGGASKFLADALKEQLIEGPRLFQCGKALSQTGGHADYVPVGQPGMEGASTCCGGHGAAISLGRVVDGVPGCLKATREELKAGADFIKIMMGGGVSSEYDPIEAIQYSPEEVRAITSTAWQMGKKMVSGSGLAIRLRARPATLDSSGDSAIRLTLPGHVTDPSVPRTHTPARPSAMPSTTASWASSTAISSTSPQPG